MSSIDHSPRLAEQHLRQLRAALLRLHKALLDFERVQYEQVHGRVPSSGALFRLVVDHEWFSWLRPISQLIVQVDEALATQEPVPPEQMQGLVDTARRLTRPAEAGTPQAQRYFQAIQRDPNIALLHSDVANLLAAHPQQ